MSKVKAILFNGPPRSGKDTAVEYVKQQLLMYGAHPAHFPIQGSVASNLKLAAHALFGEPTLHADAFEDCKDEPHPIFLGRTPRSVYIKLSEDFAKLNYGKSFFGKIFAQAMENQVKKQACPGFTPVVLCSDLGFREEARELVNWVGAENVLIVHLSRAGTSFINDSRNYIHLPDVRACSIENIDLHDFKREVFTKVRCWLENAAVYPPIDTYA